MAEKCWLYLAIAMKKGYHAGSLFYIGILQAILLPYANKDLDNLFTVVAFAAAIRQQAIALGPQCFILNGLSMNRGQTFFIQGLDNLSRDAGNKRVGWNNGTFGNNSSGSHNGALTDNSTIQNGGVHANQAVVLNSAGVEQSAVTNSYIITYDAGIIVSNV